ncbi:hypothetical protein B6S09_00345 [Oceanimonas baumannii]|uniref:Uncharacterized protein n=1 Tax=Oceanimonas baumannii TaxID=129578 RepID=A0A235CND0_9GAMM|nr:hypothetical protein B6S09_00345 [Oceanimonas baumannii]
MNWLPAEGLASEFKAPLKAGLFYFDYSGACMKDRSNLADFSVGRSFPPAGLLHCGQSGRSGHLVPMQFTGNR